MGMLLATSGPADALSTKSPKITTAQALAAAIARTGLGCNDYTPPDPNNISLSIGGVAKADEGSCMINGDTEHLSVYKSTADLANAFAAAKTILCAFLHGRTIYLVTTANWSITVASSTTGPALAKKLHATTKSIRCP
jgi:hypothetical protein